MSMKPEITEQVQAVIIDGDNGTMIYPEASIVDAIDAYGGYEKCDEIEVWHAYFARLSMPGYLDCTDWHGPYQTTSEALKDIADLYDLDDESAA